MAAARAHTALMEMMTKAAETAINSSGGVTIWLHSNKYGVEGSAKLARALSRAFYAHAARLRRRDERKLGEDKTIPRDSDARGVYDQLALYTLPLDNNEGWKLEFIKERDAFFDLLITDNASGLPIGEVNEAMDERARLLLRAEHHRGDFTVREWDKLTGLDAEFLRRKGMADELPWHAKHAFGLNFPREHARSFEGASTVNIIPEPQAPRVDELEEYVNDLDAPLFGDD